METPITEIAGYPYPNRISSFRLLCKNYKTNQYWVKSMGRGTVARLLLKQGYRVACAGQPQGAFAPGQAAAHHGDGHGLHTFSLPRSLKENPADGKPWALPRRKNRKTRPRHACPQRKAALVTTDARRPIAPFFRRAGGHALRRHDFPPPPAAKRCRCPGFLPPRCPKTPRQGSARPPRPRQNAA